MSATAKSLQSCPTLCDPTDSSPPEHWSGLPFPSPMQESEKWNWSRSVTSDPQRPHGLQPSRLFRPWDFPGKSTGVGCHCLLRYVWELWIFSFLTHSYYQFSSPLESFHIRPLWYESQIFFPNLSFAFYLCLEFLSCTSVFVIVIFISFLYF